MSCNLFDFNAHMQLMEHALPVDISSGLRAFPQHYYVFDNSLKSLTSIVSAVSTTDDVVIFASEDESGLYVQVGLIGKENYHLLRHDDRAKIVYGRKWRIDRNIPTPEIVQTLFLAVQKAKEHEVRELLTLKPKGKTTYSTPFSSHQDIELLKLSVESSSQNIDTKQPLDVETRLAEMKFAGCYFAISFQQPLPKNRLILDLSLICEHANQDIPAEFLGTEISIIVDVNEPNSLYFRLMEACISISNRHVAESFLYKGFNRFSETLDPHFIGSVSLQSRQYSLHLQDEQFKQVFARENAKIDQDRVPDMGISPLKECIEQRLNAYGDLSGYLPDGFSVNIENESNRKLG